MNKLGISICNLLMLFSTIAIADIYQCQDVNGKRTFTDEPCKTGLVFKDGTWISAEKEENRKQELKRAYEEKQVLASEKMKNERAKNKLEPGASKQTNANNNVQSKTVPMKFSICLATKESTIANLGVSPRNIIPIVNTGILTVTRVCTIDGSVLITCSKLDEHMVITRSDAHYDVGCR